jgi:DNA-binding transcriptional LysR family regulator
MDQLAALEAFVRVAETRSFSEAARALRLSPSVVSKRVADLERAYGAQLFARTTRRVSLTAAGQALLVHAGTALSALEDARQALGAETAAPRGRLRIGAPTSFGSLVLGPAVCAFRERYPQVVVELVLGDRGFNPAVEGFDLVLDDSDRPPQAFVARALPPIRRVACAAPEYLERLGAPRVPGDLAAHDCIHYSELESGVHWRFVDSRGRGQRVRVRAVLASNNARVMLDAALAGQGVVLLPLFVAASALKRGALVSVLSQWTVPSVSLALVYARSAFRPLRARLMLEHLLQTFARDPAPWEAGAA